VKTEKLSQGLDKPRFAIVSHMDLNPKFINLDDLSESVAKMQSELQRWFKIEYENVLWDEFLFMSQILNKKPDEFNIWEMSLFSGLHLKSTIKKIKPDAQTLNIDYISKYNLDEKLNEIEKFKPDYLLLSATFYLTHAHLNESLKIFRGKFSDLKIIIGGNFIFKELFMDPKKKFTRRIPKNVYLVNSRYGELELGNILDGELEKHPENKVIENLTSKENTDKKYLYDVSGWAVDFDLIDHQSSIAPMRTAVGCTFRCAFCSYPTVGGNFSTGEIDTVINQLKSLHRRNVKQVHFMDDTLNVPLDRFKVLLEKMIKEKLTNFKIYSFLRCQYLDEETTAMMGEIGWDAVLLGIESGSNTILKNMKKGAVIEKYEKGIEWLKAYNIKTFGAIIVGFPGETMETVQESVDFLNRSKLDFTYVQPFYFLHNSPIYKNQEKYGLTGKGMQWAHRTMNSAQTMEILNNIFFEVQGPLHANEEYAMWEYVYFIYKGFDLQFYIDYRRMINSIRADSIKKYHDIDRPYKHHLSLKDFLSRYEIPSRAPQNAGERHRQYQALNM